MKITKNMLREIIKEEILKEIELEQDFKKGMRVTFNKLEKVVKTTASGKQKVDYVRMPMEGVITREPDIDRFSAEPGFATVAVDGEPEEITVRIAELRPA
tara:strand:- start:682 stop:981 length:300 start_codon:yes stop_codon:yes gene_type:complete